MNDIVQAIGSVGFPAVCCVVLFFGCKYMLDNQQKNTDKMFEMYSKETEENRKAIEACTKAVEKLCDKIDAEGGNKDG